MSKVTDPLQQCRTALGQLKLRGDALAAVAAALAEAVVPRFEAEFPQEAQTLKTAIDECWGVRDQRNLEELLERTEACVPSSEDAPLAGAAIPAGETVIAAVRTALEPTYENAEAALDVAYVAVEMDAFLTHERQHPSSGFREAVDASQQSSLLTSFVSSVAELVRAAAEESELSRLRGRIEVDWPSADRPTRSSG